MGAAEDEIPLVSAAAGPGGDENEKTAPGPGGDEKEKTAPGPGGDEKKTLWPELEGWDEFDAAHAILQDRHDVRVHYYDYCRNAPPPGFDPKRVVLFSNSRHRVVTVPKLG